MNELCEMMGKLLCVLLVKEVITPDEKEFILGHITINDLIDRKTTELESIMKGERSI